ncbi:MAG: FHA domain-containing protein [Gammaproteobacteria bacterium]|nr:FHA domain-containing protein [Gammaproteobacteria bacterium]
MLSKLIIRHNGRKIDELIIKRDVVTLGRKADNDLRLEDSTVSNRHARIQRRTDGLYVEDCDSTNGTFVNGKQVQTKKLLNGDVVVIGKYTVVHEVVEEEPLTTELDPTLQIGKQEFAVLLARLSKSSSDESIGPLKLNKKTLNWIAQDENGVWWGFENEPITGVHGWLDTLDGTKILLKQESKANPGWRDTLRKL